MAIRHPTYVKALPKLQMFKKQAEQRAARTREHIMMELVVASFNAGYEARQNEEAEARALRAEIEVAAKEENTQRGREGKG